MKCSHCAQTERQVKVGRNTSGTQRYLCKACGHKYTPEPKPPGYAQAVRQQALRLYVDGMNLRRIGRVLGMSYQSVANWAKSYAAQLPETPPAPTESVAVAELDEVYTFVGDKKTASTC
jgi:transposase-like protein